MVASIVGALMGAAGVAAGIGRAGRVFSTGDVVLLVIAAGGCVLNLHLLAERFFLDE